MERVFDTRDRERERERERERLALVTEDDCVGPEWREHSEKHVAVAPATAPEGSVACGCSRVHEDADSGIYEELLLLLLQQEQRSRDSNNFIQYNTV